MKGIIRTSHSILITGIILFPSLGEAGGLNQGFFKQLGGACLPLFLLGDKPLTIMEYRVIRRNKPHRKSAVPETASSNLLENYALVFDDFIHFFQQSCLVGVYGFDGCLWFGSDVCLGV